MKKLAFFSILLMSLQTFIPVGFADDGSGFAIYQMQMNALKEQKEAKTVRMCGETHISFAGNQGPRDDEFLYDTLNAYNSVSNRPDGGTVNGTVFECDDAHCTAGHVQTMGPNHVFEGKVVKNAAKYVCKTGLADRWVKQYEMCQYRGTFLELNEWYQSNQNKSRLSKSDCLQFDLNVDPNATAFNAKCESISGVMRLRCYPIECPQNMELRDGKCVAKNTQSPTPTPTPVNPGNGSSLQKCLDSRTSAEGKACCYVSTSIATWDGSKCNCRDASRTFDVASRQCVANTTAPVVTGPYQCSAQTLAWLREMMVKYNSDTAITGLIRRILEYCTNDANRSQMQFENMITELNVLISRYDQAQADRDREIDVQRATERERQMRETRTREVSVATNNINTIVSDLNNLKSGLDVTVWRTEDGSFNTSRLVSDSVAGVVLGTAGGLITSNVIKKNQVKGGFDDISCTVGGQVVAGWGDEFTVGIH